jgi:hypothetical protein
MTMRPLLLHSIAAACLAALPLTISAQADPAAATMPQFASVKIGAGAAAKTVSQFSIPFVVVVPFGSRFNIDVASAFASSDVSVNGASISSISGLTDTQVRANFTLGNDAIVLTVGANVPTGQYKIPEAKSEAAGQIGNDFLLFPTTTYGAGMSTTGGIAVAHTLGDWNVGIAGSFRKSTRFDAFKSSTDGSTLTFTPADEVRARVGADRAVGNGRLSLGLTYSTFGNDQLANTSYATGSRFIGQGSYYVPVGNADLVISGWALHRAKGEQFGGPANPETVLNGAVSLGFHAGSLLIEPSFEGRDWMVDGVKAGLLGNTGLRLRWSAGPVTFIPSATFQYGKLFDLGTGDTIDLQGWRAAITLRIH